MPPGRQWASSSPPRSRNWPLFFLRTRPQYRQPELDPYGEQIGDDEESDPEHLAGSLVRLVASTPGQEVASHTFSHFYCLEDGQDETSFRADLAAAQAIAAQQGLQLTSLVLPRNQWNPRYASAVLDNGFDTYRGPQPSWGHQAKQQEKHTGLNRAARLVDTYAGVSPPPTMAWNQVLEDSGLCNVAASAFLRPFDPRRRLVEPLRQSRLKSRAAGRRSPRPDLPSLVAPSQLLPPPAAVLRSVEQPPR